MACGKASLLVTLGVCGWLRRAHRDSIERVDDVKSWRVNEARSFGQRRRAVRGRAGGSARGQPSASAVSCRQQATADLTVASTWPLPTRLPASPAYDGRISTQRSSSPFSAQHTSGRTWHHLPPASGRLTRSVTRTLSNAFLCGARRRRTARRASSTPSLGS